MTCARRERWAPMVEEKPKLRRSSGGMRRTALSLGARGESRGRREQVRRGGLARRGERAEGALVALGRRRLDGDVFDLILECDSECNVHDGSRGPIPNI